MHEMSLLRDLLKKITQVAHDEGSDRVVGVRVKLGALAHISADHFREHFEHASIGHVAEGAELQITELTDTNDPLAQEIILESVELT